MPWHSVERGEGRPLVLIHGIGMSHSAWTPVIPLLAKHRRVIAVDIAGFGLTPPLPSGTTPDCINLAAALGQSLREMGITSPVDLVGNSLGGLIALEAAKQGLARSVMAISPAGLWHGEAPGHIKPVFDVARFGARHLAKPMHAALRIAPLRSLLLGLPLSLSSWRMPAEEAIKAAKNFVAATAFDETRESARALTGATELKLPITVAFGTRDWLLTPSCRQRDLLPIHTLWLRPAGWGHVPMWDNPPAVSEMILKATA